MTNHLCICQENHHDDEIKEKGNGETLRSKSIKQAIEEEQRGLSKPDCNDFSGPNSKGSSEVDEINGNKHCLSYITTKKIGTWNVRSINLGKLEIVKREMERTGIEIMGVRDLR